MMRGSVAERFLRKARCPVLVARKPAHDFVTSGKDTDPVSIKRIVLGMDFSEHVHHSLKYARSFAKGYDAQLAVVHVVENSGGSSPRAGTISKATNEPRESGPPGDGRSPAVKYLARVGKLYQQITELTVESKTGLVISGFRGHGSLNRTLFGSTVPRVIQLGSCPVLAVNF